MRSTGFIGEAAGAGGAGGDQLKCAVGVVAAFSSSSLLLLLLLGVVTDNFGLIFYLH